MFDIPAPIPNSPECQAAADAAHKKVVEALESKGITLAFLAEKLLDELEAHETKVFHGTKTQTDSKGNEFSTPEIIYSKPLISWKTRQEARKDAHKLLNHYPQVGVDLNERPILVIMPKIKKEIPE